MKSYLKIISVAACDLLKNWQFFIDSLSFLHYTFQERDEWVAAIEQQILASLQGNESSKKQSSTDPAGILAIRNTRGNNLCADCGAASKYLRYLTW